MERKKIENLLRENEIGNHSVLGKKHRGVVVF